jgi:hypothetical protein
MSFWIASRNIKLGDFAHLVSSIHPASVMMLWWYDARRLHDDSRSSDTHIRALGKFWQLSTVLLEHNETTSSQLSQRNSRIEMKVLTLNHRLMEIATIWQHQRLHITPKSSSFSQNNTLNHRRPAWMKHFRWLSSIRLKNDGHEVDLWGWCHELHLTSQEWTSLEPSL